VVSLANTFVNERELRHFSGGRETNNFLIARGFPDILNKQTGRKIGIEAEDEGDAEVGLALAGAVLGLFGLALPASSKLEMSCTWLLFVVAGYIQWFVLVPRFLARRKITSRAQ
jgi:hypothetical protein